MENKGLLFIPDISGFTRFINESEIEHSRLIIQELLEILLNANELELEVSEIEGDAILFYKFGESPDLKKLYKQVEKMFWDFHRHLNSYERGRFCQCSACTSAINLTLKIITHYGEFTGYNVKNFHKLIGRDVIVAHELLKNDIALHEYWLVSKSLYPRSPALELAQWMRWCTSAKQTENGSIPFYYVQLNKLKHLMPPEPLALPGLSNKVKMFSVSQEYEADMITLFHAAGDPRYRGQWRVGVKSVEEIEHILPRVGMKFRSILADGQTVYYYSSCYYHPEKVVFSESDEKELFATNYILEKVNEDHTRLTLEYYLKKSLGNQILFQLTKKKDLENVYRQSLQNLTKVVKEIQLSDETWFKALKR